MTPPNDPALHRDLGRLEGRVGAVESRISDVQFKVDEMHRILMQAQGGWRLIALVGGLSAALSALLIKVAGVLWR